MTGQKEGEKKEQKLCNADEEEGRMGIVVFNGEKK